jgi:hypothetical protein
MARPPLLSSSKGAVPLHGPTQDVENSALGPASRIFNCLETEKASFVAGTTHPYHAIAKRLGLDRFWSKYLWSPASHIAPFLD